MMFPEFILDLLHFTLQSLFTDAQVIFLHPFRELVYINEIWMQLEINSSSIQSLESTLGMFPCQLLLGYQHFHSNCMASGYICAFNADRSCRAQLLMEHSYPFSHYCLLYVIFTRPQGNHQGLTCVCVCVHSVANKENRPTPWKHLFNTLNRNLNIQTKDSFLITLQMSSAMDVNTTPWENWKLLKHVQSARTCMHNFIRDHKTQSWVLLPWQQCLLTCFYMHTQAAATLSLTHKTGNNQKPVSRTKHTVLDVYFGPVSMVKWIKTFGWRKSDVMLKEKAWHFMFYLDIFLR